MSFLEKIMFWKKTDDIITPANAGLDVPMPDFNNPAGMPGMNMDSQLALPNTDPGLPSQDFGFGQTNNNSMGFNQNQSQQSISNNPYNQPAQSQPQFGQSNSFQQGAVPQSNGPPSDIQRDVQVLSLKLDAIKSEIDSISQRVKNIERIAENEQTQQTAQQKRWY